MDNPTRTISTTAKITSRLWNTFRMDLMLRTIMDRRLPKIPGRPIWKCKIRKIPISPYWNFFLVVDLHTHLPGLRRRPQSKSCWPQWRIQRCWIDSNIQCPSPFFALPSEMKIEVEKALQIYLMEGNLLRYVEAANERRAFCIRRATQYLSSFSCLCRHSVFYGSSRRNFTAH